MIYFKKYVQAAAPLLIVLIAWQIVALWVIFLRGVAFPTPAKTFLRLLDLIEGVKLIDHSIYKHVASSLKRWIIGFSIAAVCGLAHGLLAGRILAVEKATARIPQLLLLIPGLAWIPVAILLFGIGEPATIFMIAISSFAPIAINVQSGIKNVDIRFIHAAQMMGTGRRSLFFSVLIPAALPSILTGLRIGLGTGWRVLVAAEMVVGTGTGLGYSIIQARWTLDYPSSFACIVVICGIGLLFEKVVLNQIEKHTIARWAPVSEKR
jgi:ABC-type nitrate/sulfonate/bicarbonate transport system permease component